LQKNDLGLFRSDYFYCCDSQTIKQVEFNTIASSLGGITSLLFQAHKFVLAELGHNELLSQIPDNHALQGLSEAMIEAWKIYNVPSSVILFIVEDVTYNICDQKFHEFEIREQCPSVYVVRKTLTQVADEGSLTSDKRLIVDGHEIAMIYFRCGYSPDQYFGDKEWNARLMMERSLAIKSPSIHYHLAGTKKVQQQLAINGVLEKYFDDSKKIDKIRGIFTGLYSLDAKTDEGRATFEKAMKTPTKFVVKPQREGGGNNIYGEDIVPFLKSIENSSERDAYIMMDRIHPPTTENYMVRPHTPTKRVKVISELGIFGYIIGDDKGKILKNKQVGHMLRTKLSDANEGGVAAGSGALDSVFLLDVDRCCEIEAERCGCEHDEHSAKANA